MANPVKVSVVIPVYNTAPYLEQCLDSIVGQSLVEIEVICVDDGSTDDSPAILESYAAKDLRVRVMHQQNQFAGVARNRGLSNAAGKYVIFFDSDDYMAFDALEKMYARCEQDDADICVCAGKRYFEKLDLTVDAPGYLEVKRLPEAIPFNRFSNAEHIFSFTTIMTWNKMYRTAFLREHALAYSDMRNGEDVEMSALALWLAKRITVVRDPLVFYRIGRDDSLVGTLDASAIDPLIAWDRVWQRIKGDIGESKRSFDCKVLGVIRHTFRNVRSAQAFDACYDYLKEGALADMDLRPRPKGYYYTPWYNGFVAHLRDDDREDFKTYLIYSASQDLGAEEARKLDFRRKMRESEQQKTRAERALKSTEKQLAELERKFSKVEWIYRIGRDVKSIPRKLSSLVSGDASRN